MLRILYFFHLLFISYGFTPNPLNADFFRNNRSCRMSYYAWAHLLHNGKDLQKLIFRSRSLSAQGIAVPWPQGKKKRERKRSYTFSELWKSQFSQTLFYPHETSWWFPVSHRWILCSHQVWISLSALREATALLQLTPLPAPVAGNYSFHFSSKAEPKRTALKTDKNPMVRELRKKKYMTIGSTEGRYVETWATTAVPFLSMTGIEKNIKL